MCLLLSALQEPRDGGCSCRSSDHDAEVRLAGRDLNPPMVRCMCRDDLAKRLRNKRLILTPHEQEQRELAGAQLCPWRPNQARSRGRIPLVEAVRVGKTSTETSKSRGENERVRLLERMINYRYFF